MDSRRPRKETSRTAAYREEQARRHERARRMADRQRQSMESEESNGRHTPPGPASWPRKHRSAAMTKTLSFAAVHFTVAFGVGYALTGSVVVGGVMALVES